MPAYIVLLIWPIIMITIGQVISFKMNNRIQDMIDKQREYLNEGYAEAEEKYRKAKFCGTVITVFGGINLIIGVMMAVGIYA